MHNLPAIPKRISSALIGSMAAGVVARTGLEYIAIGRTNEIEAMLEDYTAIEQGGSAFRLICGRYGSGKSFLIQLMRSHAIDRGFAAADADLSPERRLAGSKGQGLATYRELITNLSTKASPDGNALAGILNKWITGIQMAKAKELGLKPNTPELVAASEVTITETIAGFSSMVHGFDFANVVLAYYQGVISGEESQKQAALRWLRGEYTTKTEARKELPVSSVIDDESWYDYLKLMSALMVKAGYKGLIIFIDEAVNLYKIVQSVSREANYEKILNIFNDCMQGRLSHLGFIFGGTPQFVEDPRRGLFSYEALRSRLSGNRFAAEGAEMLYGVRDYRTPVLKLAPLTPEEILALLKRAAYIHSVHYGWTPPVSDDQLALFVADAAGRMGADVLLTPREVVRDFIGLLNILHQNPGTTFESVASDLVKSTPSASEGSGQDDLFAEFSL